MLKVTPFYIQGKREAACLFIHGFTASPSEVYPTARLLHDWSGYTVSGLLLPGHGSSPRELNKTSWEVWFNAVDREITHLRHQHQKVFIVGLSMGGLLALHAAAVIPGLAGAVAINTPVYNRSPLLSALAPMLKYVRPYWPKKMDRHMRELEKEGRFAYRVLPIQAFVNMLKLRKAVMREIDRISAPVLVMQSLQDESVKTESAVYIMKKTGARLIELPHSRHVATMGPDQELIARSIIDFMEGIIDADYADC